MNKNLVFVFIFGLIAGWNQGAYAAATEDPGQAKGAMILPFPDKTLSKSSLSPFQESLAYQQYSRRPKTELSKLVYLMDRLKKGHFIILYNGRPYEAVKIATLVKGYIALNYRKEKAEDWIQNHAYKSRSKGQVIFLQSPDGEKRVLKDVLLEELKLLPA